MGHYNTDEEHGSIYWFKNQRNSLAVWGVVGGRDVVYRVALPYQMYSMSHITLAKQQDSISLHE